jgi:hypothetical protein
MIEACTKVGFFLRQIILRSKQESDYKIPGKIDSSEPYCIFWVLWLKGKNDWIKQSQVKQRNDIQRYRFQKNEIIFPKMQTERSFSLKNHSHIYFFHSKKTPFKINEIMLLFFLTFRPKDQEQYRFRRITWKFLNVTRL